MVTYSRTASGNAVQRFGDSKKGHGREVKPPVRHLAERADFKDTIPRSP